MAIIEHASNQRATRHYLVFFGHYSGDRFVAHAIAEKMRQQGCEVWIDENELAGGDPIYGKILEAVDTCDEAIVLLSPPGLNSKWIPFELGAICGQHKRVTPVLDHVGPEAVPIIPGVKAIDINHFEQIFLPELARRIAEKNA
ncbi:MAG TPA: toll/interleukin-1 receptor domain-containing protein [Thermoanaerobaculia bacterium]|nr:toll/interleukin-1 receptor domain-containing protein [Thermoanaerobaculia bacterium]